MLARCFRIDRVTRQVKRSEHYGSAVNVWEAIDTCEGAHEIVIYGDDF